MRKRYDETPAMPLPVGEILREPLWQALDAQARGILVSLLMISWRDGALTADPVVAARLAGLDAGLCQQYWDALGPWFMPHPSRAGHLFPPCLLEPLAALVKRRLNVAQVFRAKQSSLAPGAPAAAPLSRQLKDLQSLASQLGIKLS